MIDTPINPRADVSPTCRGSTGTEHNGWNPSPRFWQIYRTAPQASGQSLETTTDGPRAGWEYQPRPGSAGVFHAPHRYCQCPRSSWPGWGLCDRHPGGLGWSPDSFQSVPGIPDRRLRSGLRRFWGRRGGRVLASSSPARLGRGGRGSCSEHRSGAHVRSGAAGGVAPGNRSVADPARVGALVFAGLVLVDRRRGSPEASECVRCDPSSLARVHPASSRGRSNGLRPVHSRIHGVVDVLVRSAPADGPLGHRSARSFHRIFVAPPVGGNRS
jgi:hypothetical protein